MIKKSLFLVILMLIISSPAFCQLRDSVLIETGIYTIMYSEVKEQPLWIEYFIECQSGGLSRSGFSFWSPEDLHTSDDDDYRGTIWDKGHLAPAAAFNCDREMLYSTFNYANATLQHRGLNRGVWAKLEEFERNLANFHFVMVRVNVVFEKVNIQPNGAWLPSHFHKTIYYDDYEISFLFPNENTVGKNFMDFLIHSHLTN